MRRLTFLLALLLLVALVPTSSLSATEAETAPATPPAEEPADSPANEPVDPPKLIVPEPVAQTCSAELDCEDGNIISCTGNSTCTVNEFWGYVECDGNRTTCPNFCRIGASVDCGSCGRRTCSCTSLSGDCEQISGGVQCDGIPRFCLCPPSCL